MSTRSEADRRIAGVGGCSAQAAVRLRCRRRGVGVGSVTLVVPGSAGSESGRSGSGVGVGGWRPGSGVGFGVGWGRFGVACGFGFGGRRLGRRLRGRLWRRVAVAPHLSANRTVHIFLPSAPLYAPTPIDVPALAQDVGAMPGRAHEHLVDRGGGLVVRVGVPADVLAGQLVAVADRVELVEDLAVARDRVAEVVALDHVLAAPSGDRGQRRVDLERWQPGARAARLVRATSCFSEAEFAVPALQASVADGVARLNADVATNARATSRAAGRWPAWRPSGARTTSLARSQITGWGRSGVVLTVGVRSA